MITTRQTENQIDLCITPTIELYGTRSTSTKEG